MPHLTGKTIILRDYRREDVPFIRQWVNDPEAVKFLSTNFWFPQSTTDTDGFVDRMMSPSQFSACYVIADKADESYIGQIDIFRIDWKLRQGEVGMVIGREVDRGRGVGTEALELLEEYAFQTLGLERLELEVHMQNERARRCYERAGFVMEGVKRHAYYSDGAFQDLGMLSILRGEWQQRQHA